MTCAMALRGVTASEKLLLLALANYADENMTCYPSHKRLAEDACLSSRTVQTLLAALEERRMISRMRRTRPDGSRSSDSITLHFSMSLTETTSGGTEIISGGVGKPLPGGTEMVSPLTTFEPVIEPINPLPLNLAPLAKLIGLSASGSFAEIAEAIWLAQPSPGGKRRTTRPDVNDALAAAIKRGGHPGDVLRAIRAFYALPANRKDAGQYANGAKVVMAKDRWREYLPAAKPHPPPSEIDPAYRAHLEAHFRATGEWKPEWGERPKLAV